MITIIRLEDGCVYTSDDEWEAVGTRIDEFESIRLLPRGVLIEPNDPDHGPPRPSRPVGTNLLMRVRILCPLPVTVASESTSVEMCLRSIQGYRWELQAKRAGRAGHFIAGGPWRSEQDAQEALYESGFEPPAEGTPPAAVLRRLVATGRAERITDAAGKRGCDPWQPSGRVL